MKKKPHVIVANRQLTVDVRPELSLLNNFLAQEVAIATVCGGKAVCGRCRIRVLEGMRFLSPVRPAEAQRLGEDLLADGWRLACQSHCLGEVVVEIPDPRAAETDSAGESHP